MKTFSIQRICAVLALAFASAASMISAQEVIRIDPIFEYPSAPENLESLTDKSNYLVEHFWDQLDPKKKNFSQAALNDAFAVYSAPLQFADRDVALKSIDDLLKKIKKNATLLIQMTKAAEDNLFSPKARIVSDEAYIPFLETVLKNKKVPEIRKARWKNQLNTLKNSLIGAALPSFPIEERKGGKGVFEPRARYTIIEFGDPTCDDCRFSRLTLDTNVELTHLVEDEKVEVAFIIVTPEEGWQAEVASYPKKWLVAASEGVDDIIDIRQSPTFYVLDSEGKVVAKNISAERAAKIVINSLSEEESK